MYSTVCCIVAVTRKCLQMYLSFVYSTVCCIVAVTRKCLQMYLNVFNLITLFRYIWCCHGRVALQGFTDEALPPSTGNGVLIPSKYIYHYFCFERFGLKSTSRPASTHRTHM